METQKCLIWTRRRSLPSNRSSQVLVVDDNQNAARALAAYLSLEGMDVRDAGGCEEAMDIVSTWRPDVVVLDIMMPVHDGFDTARALRGRFHRAISIVAFTALDSAHVAVHTAGKLFDGYCQKGASPARLVNVLGDLWEPRVQP